MNERQRNMVSVHLIGGRKKLCAGGREGGGMGGGTHVGNEGI